MGLLDMLSSLNPEQTQGLLAAAAQISEASGPSRVKPNVMGALAQGGLAYQGSIDGQRRKKLEEEAAQQAFKINGYKMRDAESDFAKQEQMRADEEKARQIMMARAKGGGIAQGGQVANPMLPGAQGAPAQAAGAGSFGMPTMESKLAEAQEYQAAGLMSHAKAAYEEAMKLRPKYSQKADVANGPDGKPVMFVMDEYGNRKVLDGMQPREKMETLNLGNREQVINPYDLKSGQSFQRTMTPDGIAADRRAAQSYALRKQEIEAKSAGGVDGLLPDDVVSMMAEQYMAGDTSVMQNLGRGAQGAQNIIKLRTAVANMARSKGMGGTDLAAKNAEFMGTKAGQRSAGTRIANVEMAVYEAQNLVPLALEASDKVARSSMLPFGKAQMMFNSQTNDPAMREFVAANNALVNVYARAISPTGQPTVADKEHARELLSTAYDKKAYDATVRQMQREMVAAQQAPQQVRKAFNESVTGKGGHGPASAAPGGQYSVTAPNGKTYTFPDAKALANFKLSAGIK